MRRGGRVKRLIMGTAGHIDHGKTALVKALTGTDCDTHIEEKRRGITINLGFACLALPNGDIVGIIDVPGHRDFVHTMVAGAHGIDFVLMVVAADEGVMPQTREHLQICQALGIKRGIVAVNKADLADGPALETVRSGIREFAKGTFLEGCPMVDVSAVSGRGIMELAAAIADVASRSSPRPAGGVFRMYIDRIFSVSGFGTVVTGSVTGGTLCAGGPAWLLPPGKELRVRRIERYGADVAEAVAGDRASLNLVGLSKEEFTRGMLVADRPLVSSRLLDANVRLFTGVKPLCTWSQATLIMGTFEAQARIHLLEKDRLAGGETGLAQIILPQPCVAQAQDAFVLRASAGDTTIGGGEVIDPHPLHHRRRPPHLVERLKGLSGGKLSQLIALEAAKHPAGIDHVSLAETLNVSPGQVAAEIAPDPPQGILVLSSPGKHYLIAQARRETLVSKAVKTITEFHRSNPFDEKGRTAEELQGMLGLEQGASAAQFTLVLLESLVNNGTLKRVGHTFAIASRSVSLSPRDGEQGLVIEEFIKKSGMQTPLHADLAAHAQRNGIDEKRLRQLLQYLVSLKKLYLVEGQYLHASIVDKSRTIMLSALVKDAKGLTVAQFRDLVSGNRKICLLLYALFDGEGITERQGDVRVITDKGKKLLKVDG
jgi:selenocysteine-specific elongation factor